MSTTGIVLLSIVSFIVGLLFGIMTISLCQAASDRDDNIRYTLDSDFVETDEES